MNISDLNHLEVVEESNVVGGSFFPYYTTYDNEYVNVDVNFDFKNKFESYVNLQDNSASAKALADAYGKETKADSWTYTLTNDYASSAVSISGSATEKGYY
ncbi:hypothetical protein [Mastigocoleus sp. MO_188.B34]|uniref:hypothetical protein n=1 Tax=Mastigocoleus sp. MO_188.B34 TaxID=3036635 RepID=UPI0026053D95|nr:hypothetical protein [Mastigocoleus sp. MO_188.B34]MDJ0696524.1 hypothetical protein [Mastigocoleus sp. MO_188.B34]